MKWHTPVMVEEVLFFLKTTTKVSHVIDATLGDGGHTTAILRALPACRVTGIDWDRDMRQRALTRLKAYENRFTIIPGNNAAVLNDFEGTADAVLFDLGVASFHFDHAGRGFSFKVNEPLDMRLDQTLLSRAADLIAQSSVAELATILREFGEERFSAPIAKAIKGYPGRIDTTGQLVSIVESAIPRRYRFSGRSHFATRVFQALRLAVNQELASLSAALPAAFKIIKPGGLIIAISFHSLEDRILKWQFRDWQKADLATILTKKPIQPKAPEAANNPRSRSAKLRVIQKI